MTYYNIFHWYNQEKYGKLLLKHFSQKGKRNMSTTTLNCERLISCRKKLGITKQEAAKRMQMSQPAYLRYESGERTPSIHVIHFMANILGTSADYLTSKTDNPNPNCYLISSITEPELFSLIETYSNSDDKTKSRLLSYFSKISCHV